MELSVSKVFKKYQNIRMFSRGPKKDLDTHLAFCYVQTSVHITQQSLHDVEHEDSERAESSEPKVKLV